MLELELDARREKGRAFQQAADHRVHALPGQPTETLGDPGIFLGELLAVLHEEPEFLVVEVETLLVHRVTGP